MNFYFDGKIIFHVSPTLRATVARSCRHENFPTVPTKRSRGRLRTHTRSRNVATPHPVVRIEALPLSHHHGVYSTGTDNIRSAIHKHIKIRVCINKYTYTHKSKGKYTYNRNHMDTHTCASVQSRFGGRCTREKGSKNVNECIGI